MGRTGQLNICLHGDCDVDPGLKTADRAKDPPHQGEQQFQLKVWFRALWTGMRHLKNQAALSPRSATSASCCSHSNERSQPMLRRRPSGTSSFEIYAHIAFCRRSEGEGLYRTYTPGVCFRTVPILARLSTLLGKENIRSPSGHQCWRMSATLHTLLTLL